MMYYSTNAALNALLDHADWGIWIFPSVIFTQMTFAALSGRPQTLGYLGSSVCITVWGKSSFFHLRNYQSPEKAGQCVLYMRAIWCTADVVHCQRVLICTHPQRSLVCKPIRYRQFLRQTILISTLDCGVTNKKPKVEGFGNIFLLKAKLVR